MKKILFLMILFSPVCMFSQLNYGIKTGINISNLNLDVDENYHVGPSVGVSADFYFPFMLGFKGALLYSFKGANGVGQTLATNGSIRNMDINLQYLNLPVEIAYKFKTYDNVNIVLGAGGYASLGLGGKSRAELLNKEIIWSSFSGDNYTILANSGEEPKRLDGFKRLDYGLSFSVGMEYKHFNVGLSYQLGMNEIHEKLPLTNVNPKNRAWSFAVGYNFFAE